MPKLYQEKRKYHLAKKLAGLLCSGILLASCLLAGTPRQLPLYLEDQPFNTEAQIETWYKQWASRDKDSLLQECHQTYGFAVRQQDNRLAAYSALMLGQLYMIQDNPDSLAYYLDKGLYWNSFLSETMLSASLCNLAGIHAIDYELNYPKGMAYFLQVQNLFDNDTSSLYYQMTANLAIAYNFREDTSGMPYARIVYRGGKEKDNGYLHFLGSLCLSKMFYLKGEYDSAQTYALQAESSVENAPIYACQIHTMQAKISEALGKTEEAARYYAKAFEQADATEIHGLMELHEAYGNFLLEEGKAEDAIGILEKGIQIAESRESHLYRYQLYRSLAKAYRAKGDPAKALDYYERYHDESQLHFNMENEQSLNELRIRYQTEQKERELREKEMQVIKSRQKTQFLACLSGALAVSGLILFSFYRKRNRMYREIVLKHREFQKKEKIYESLLARQGFPASPETKDASGQTPEETAATKPGTSDPALLAPIPGMAPVPEAEKKNEKDWVLFYLVEQKMYTENLYRDSGLTLEKLASLLDTNRTYLSSALNHCAQKTNRRGCQNTFRLFQRYSPETIMRPARLQDPEQLLPFLPGLRQHAALPLPGGEPEAFQGRRFIITGNLASPKTGCTAAELKRA